MQRPWNYTITNLTADRLAIDGVVLEKLGSTAKISFLSDNVNIAVSKNLISVANNGTNPEVLNKLDTYARELGNLPPQNIYLGQ